MGLLKANYVWL